MTMQATDWPNVETDPAAWRDWAAAATPLPDGVHELSWESQVVLAEAYLRGRRIAERHIKRGS
jgi:hypothetical protein